MQRRTKTLPKSSTERPKIGRQKKWEDVLIGDIVKITDKKDINKIPADLMLLYAKSDDGTCLIETKNLDGETNQKIRNAHPDLQEKYSTEEDLTKFTGELRYE